MAVNIGEIITATLTGTTMSCPNSFVFCANPQGYENPYCERDTCGIVNANPTMLLTLSWTDTDCTKNYLGCTWYNGEQKEVYASTYNITTLYFSPNSFQSAVVWSRTDASNTAHLFKLKGGYYADSSLGNLSSASIDINFIVGDLLLQRTEYTFKTTANTLSVVNTLTTGFQPTINNMSVGYPIGLTNRTGNLTTTAGITLTWRTGNGW